MTSDTAVPSVARQHLDYALGKKRVDISRLSPQEFDRFLVSVLESVDLRELRGFKPLEQVVAFNPSVSVPAGVPIAGQISQGDFDWKTQVQTVCRGVFCQTLTWKRHESDEMTTHWETQNAWGRESYLYKGIQSILVLRRPPNHSSADTNLIEVSYLYSKVPHEDKYVVNELWAKSIRMASFRKHFEAEYSRMAVELLWELRSIYSRTATELESQASSMRSQAHKMDHLGSVIYMHE